MRLTEPIETAGMFWLPGRPDTKLSGTLKVSESGRITVELAGIFDNPLAIPPKPGVVTTATLDDWPPDQPRIVGVLHQGGPITLDSCSWQNTSFSFPSGLSTSIIHAKMAFVGAEYTDQEEPIFSEFSFSIEGLDTWLSISGIKHEVGSAGEPSLIRYVQPDDIPLNIQNDVELRFSFGLHSSGSTLPRTEAAVRQSVSTFIRISEPRPVDYFSSIALRLCNLLTLALDQAVSLQSMTGYLNQEMADGGTHRALVKIYGQFAPWTEEKPTISPHDALFLYPHIAGQFEDLVAKWFDNYERLEPALDLYFAFRTRPSQFLNIKVLGLMQALEALQRRISNATEMSEEEFTVLRGSLMASCPENKREWLNPRLRNELSFTNRIRALLSPFEYWFGDPESRSALVRKIRDTRNYFTHYDEASAKHRVTDGHELFQLYMKLEALLQLHLLDLLGLDRSAIDSIVQNNAALRRRLSV